MSANPLSALAGAFTTKKGLMLVLPGAALLAVLAGIRNTPYEPANAASEPTASAIAMASAAPPSPAPSVPVKLASAANSAEFSPAQKTAIENIIKDYLITNPEVMLEVQRALQERAESAEATRLKAAIKANAKELYHRPGASIAGNPKGDVTIVEFFDYNCGFCKRALGDVTKLVEKDKNVRVVFKELPILSRGSEEAARVALAARLQGKYWEVHQALLTARGRADKASALKAAAKLGLDMTKLEKDMTSPVVEKEIMDTRALAQNMGINGTPHFIVGENVIPGAPDNLLGVLTGHVGDVRKNGCKVC